MGDDDAANPALDTPSKRRAGAGGDAAADFLGSPSVAIAVPSSPGLRAQSRRDSIAGEKYCEELDFDGLPNEGTQVRSACLRPAADRCHQDIKLVKT